MHTVCGASVLDGEEAFATLGTVAVFPDREITAGDVRTADLLAIRSQTRVDAALLHGSGVRFVGTATIGHDHMDTAFLDRAGIAWTNASGCNANSVAEYVVAALLTLAERHRFRLEGLSVGIVGVGHVGSLVAAKCTAMGMRILGNDPPRAETGTRGLYPLDHVLAESDIVTLHVPLITEGRWPTRHLAGASFFARMKPGAVFMNTSRGPVVDSHALSCVLGEGRIAHTVLDVWEGEPDYDAQLLRRVDIGTPHIAGYSIEGKRQGTLMIYRAACARLGLTPSWVPSPLSPPTRSFLTLDAWPGAGADQALLRQAVRAVYDIEADDQTLRETPSGDARARERHFTLLRKQYPPRREFSSFRIKAPGAPPSFIDRLHRLGFKAN